MLKSRTDSRRSYDRRLHGPTGEDYVFVGDRSLDVKQLGGSFSCSAVEPTIRRGPDLQGFRASLPPTLGAELGAIGDAARRPSATSTVRMA